MGTLRNITAIFFTVGLGALASALVKLDSISWPQWSFAVFFTLFRLKMFLDDLDQLESKKPHNWRFQLGFIIGITSWFFWIASAMLVSDFSKVPLFLILALATSTSWLLFEAIQHAIGYEIWLDDIDRDIHIFWIAINAMFILWLWFAYCDKWGADGLGAMFMAFSLVVFIDGACSKSLNVLTHAPTDPATPESTLSWESARIIITVFLTIGLSALASSLFKIEPILYVFAAFLGFLRIKMFLDQLYYYKTSPCRNWIFKTNFIIGLTSWFFWFASAILIRELKTELALLNVLIAIAISSFWLMVRLIAGNEWTNKKISLWLFFNTVNYIALTLAWLNNWEGAGLAVICALLCIGVFINAVYSESFLALD